MTFLTIIDVIITATTMCARTCYIKLYMEDIMTIGYKDVRLQPSLFLQNTPMADNILYPVKFVE